MGKDDVRLWDELTESIVRLPFNLITGNAYGRFIDFDAFLMALGTLEQFGTRLGRGQILVFDAADQWRFSKFLSFGDVAVYGAVHGLLTQKY